MRLLLVHFHFDLFLILNTVSRSNFSCSFPFCYLTCNCLDLTIKISLICQMEVASLSLNQLSLKCYQNRWLSLVFFSSSALRLFRTLKLVFCQLFDSFCSHSVDRMLFANQKVCFLARCLIEGYQISLYGSTLLTLLKGSTNCSVFYLHSLCCFVYMLLTSMQISHLSLMLTCMDLSGLMSFHLGSERCWTHWSLSLALS